MAHTIGIGSVVRHTQFNSKPAVVLSEDGTYWNLKGVESGKPHKWNKNYCVSEEIYIGGILDLSNVKEEPAKYVPRVGDFIVHKDGRAVRGMVYKVSDEFVYFHDGKGADCNWQIDRAIEDTTVRMVVQKPRQAGKSTAFDEAMRYSQHIIGNMANLAIFDTRQDKFINKPSEEDKSMELLIQDKVTINGADSKNMTDDTLIEFIRQAEDQITSFKAIKAKSNAITAKITQLEAGVVRLVAILDKAG